MSDIATNLEAWGTLEQSASSSTYQIVPSRWLSFYDSHKGIIKNGQQLVCFFYILQLVFAYSWCLDVFGSILFSLVCLRMSLSNFCYLYSIGKGGAW